MISAWWLILIPIAYVAGHVMNGLLGHNSQLDKCSRCQYNYYKEKSK